MSFLPQLKRFGHCPLGLVIEGGIDSPLQYIFIKSITLGSPAFISGQFCKGDQLVMVGPECLIGMTLLQAQQVLEQDQPLVELVAQRKESVKQSPILASKTDGDGKQQMKKERKLGRDESQEKENEIGNVKKREKSATIPMTELHAATMNVPEKRPENFVGSNSQVEMQGSSSITTSLVYATSSTSLNTSWNMNMFGKSTVFQSISVCIFCLYTKLERSMMIKKILTIKSLCTYTQRFGTRPFSSLTSE